MLAWLYTLVTGHPYWTGRAAAAEFGPPPGAILADRLEDMTNLEVMRLDVVAVAAMLNTERAWAVAQRPDRYEEIGVVPTGTAEDLIVGVGDALV